MTPPHSLFRPEAIAYRLQRHKTLAPPVIPDHQRVRFLLGTTLVLLIALGITTFLRPVPVQVAGMAIVPVADGETKDVALLLDAGTIPQLRPGQTVSLEAVTGGHSLTATIATVEVGQVSTSSLASMLGLDPLLTMSLPETVALAWLTLEDETSLAPGDVLRAEAMLGTAHAGSVLPLIGNWFGAER